MGRASGCEGEAGHGPAAPVQNGAMSRVVALLSVLAIAGCGLALDASAYAPRECGLDGQVIAWSGPARLAEIGFTPADPDFPMERLTEVWVTAADQPTTGVRAFCARLSDDGTGNGPWWITGDVPDDWEPHPHGG